MYKYLFKLNIWGLGIGDWGFWIGDWGQWVIPNAEFRNSNAQDPK